MICQAFASDPRDRLYTSERCLRTTRRTSSRRCPVTKNDEPFFYYKRGIVLSKNEELCIKNEEFCIKMVNFALKWWILQTSCSRTVSISRYVFDVELKPFFNGKTKIRPLKNDALAFKLMNFVFKMMNFAFKMMIATGQARWRPGLFSDRRSRWDLRGLQGALGRYSIWNLKRWILHEKWWILH